VDGSPGTGFAPKTLVIKKINEATEELQLRCPRRNAYDAIDPKVDFRIDHIDTLTARKVSQPLKILCGCTSSCPPLATSIDSE
jgi:hypothetical protein